MVYLSVQAKVRHSGKELDHWSEADPETLRRLLKLAEHLAQSIEDEIFEKENAELLQQNKDLADLNPGLW